jgi:predicted nucleotide-binding protein (sugar kinase/HSP70/actin superfamily)
MTTLAQNSVWLFVVKFGQNHTIHSRNYAFAAILATHVALLHVNIATMGCFKVSIVGTLTSIQYIAITNKYFTMLHLLIYWIFTNLTIHVTNMWK